jgi:energy-coupling factor transporter transmembrane protein EcfT
LALTQILHVVASSNLTRDVTIAVFISIWVMVILGAVFNALMITKPIKELLTGREKYCQPVILSSELTCP